MDIEVRYRRRKGGDPDAPAPHLWVCVIGPNGDENLVEGLVDTGADTTILPWRHVADLGYDPAELVPVDVALASGTGWAYKATTGCRAWVLGLERYPFELKPWFVEGDLALWGRADFMLPFGVTFVEAAQAFSLRAAA